MMLRFLLVFFLILNRIISFAQESAKKPSIMIIPSDNLLSKLNCIESITNNDGSKGFSRDYSKALVESSELLLAIQKINEDFIRVGYPSKSIIHHLKSLEEKKLIDLAINAKIDILEIVLSFEKPDIICELNYVYNKDSNGGRLAFTLEGIDSYTGKVISSIGNSGLRTLDTNIPSLLVSQIDSNINKFLQGISDHFEVIKYYGREVSLRVNLLEISTIDLDNNKCKGKSLTDFIESLIKKHTFKSNYVLYSSGSSFMHFSELKIPLFDEEGIGIGVRDWLKPIIQDLETQCGLNVYNRSIGLGGGRLVIK